MFREAKENDRVWDLFFGWGRVQSNGDVLTVEFPGYCVAVPYTHDGRPNDDHWKNQRLFWDEVKITPPPRPKRKIRKTIEGWVNIYRDKSVVCLHKTKDEAFRYGTKDRLGDPIFIRHEYEEFED